MPINWPDKLTAEETLQQWLESFPRVTFHPHMSLDDGFIVSPDRTDGLYGHPCAVLMYYGGSIKRATDHLNTAAARLDTIGISHHREANSLGYPLLYVMVDGLLDAEQRARAESAEAPITADATTPEEDNSVS
jgi:hypothetical protein